MTGNFRSSVIPQSTSTVLTHTHNTQLLGATVYATEPLQYGILIVVALWTNLLQSHIIITHTILS